MVRDAVIATNQLANHGARPNTSVEATLARTGLDEGDELSALLVGQEWRAPWPLNRAETRQALDVVPLKPAIDRPTSNAKNARNGDHGLALDVRRNSLRASPLRQIPPCLCTLGKSVEATPG